MPASAFVFTAAGDFGATSQTDQVLDSIAASGSSFTLALGDLSYSQLTPEAAWCDYVKDKLGSTYPFELISGNHEDNGPDGAINNFIACLPDRITGLTGTYGKEYYFDYQSLARVISISPDLTLDGETYSYNNGTSRHTWLTNAIDSARSANIPWVIVAMHKNCITIGEKSCEIGRDLLNLLVSKKVDLVLQGHDHTYQRSKQWAHGNGCSTLTEGSYNSFCVQDSGEDSVYTKSAGQVQIIAATGGITLYPVNTSDTEKNYMAKWMGANASPTHGYVKADVTAGKMKVDFVAASGAFTDSFVIYNGTHPDGTAVAAKGSNDVYVIEGGQRRYVGTPARLASHAFNSIKTATSADMALPLGTQLGFREGSLIKGSGSAVYAVDYESGSIRKRHITSLDNFMSLGYASQDILKVSDAELPGADGPTITNQHPDGSLVKATGSADIYTVYDGQSHYVPTPPVLTSLRGVTRMMTSADNGYPAGAAQKYYEGAILKGSGSAVYAIDDSAGTITKRHVTNIQAMLGLGYSSGDIISATDAQLPSQNGSDIN